MYSCELSYHFPTGGIPLVNLGTQTRVLEPLIKIGARIGIRIGAPEYDHLPHFGPRPELVTVVVVIVIVIVVLMVVVTTAVTVPMRHDRVEAWQDTESESHRCCNQRRLSDHFTPPSPIFDFTAFTRSMSFAQSSPVLSDAAP